MSESDEKPEPVRSANRAPAPKPEVKSDLKTPEEWAAVCGQVRKTGDEYTVSTVNGKPFDAVSRFLDRHNCAAMLHFWGADGEQWGHRHHAGEPMKLSREDYEAACEAAFSGAGDKPHMPALSPHSPLRKGN